MSTPEPPQDPPAPPSWPEPSAGSPAASEVSHRVRGILDAVEREAERLRHDAREEAGRYLEQARQYVDGLVAERQARISALTDEIISRSETVLGRLEEAAPVRLGFENLVRALGDAAERLADEVEGMHLGSVPAPPYWQTTPAVPGSAAATGHQAHQPLPPMPHPQAQPQPQAAPPPPPSQYHPPAYPPAGPPAGGFAPARPGAGQEICNLALQMAGAGRTRGEVETYLREQIGLALASEVLDGIYGAGSATDARVPWAI